MDREMQELRQGYRSEQRKMIDEPKPPEKSDEQRVIDRKLEVVEKISECLGPQSDNEIQNELNGARLAGLNREYERLERLLEDVRDSD